MAETVHPSRIKFKETQDERASRLYRAEQARYRAHIERIDRANGKGNHAPEGSNAATDDTEGRSRKKARYDGSQFTGTGGGSRTGGVGSAYETISGGATWGGAGGIGLGMGMGMGMDDLFDLRIPSRHLQQHLNLHQRLSFSTSSRDPIRNGHRETFGFTYTGTSTSTDAADTDPIPPAYTLFPDAGSADHRRASAEVHFSGGPVPSIGQMTDGEYTAWVRSGLDQLRAREEAAERAERAARRVEEETRRFRESEEQEREIRRMRRKLDRERERQDREQRRRRQEAEAKMEVGKDLDADSEISQRRRYLARWASLSGSGGNGGAGYGDDIQEVEISFGDIPWPVYRMPFDGIDLDMLDKQRIGAFAHDLAKGTTSGGGGGGWGGGGGGGGGEVKKVLREAIKNFHPDRFFGRILPRVREKDREKVREGVERCSRIINGLLAAERTA